MNHSGNHGKFPWEIFSFWIQLDLHPELPGWEEFKQFDICQLCLHFKWSKTRYQMLCNRNIQTLNKTCSVFLGNRHIECRVDTQTIVNLSETFLGEFLRTHIIENLLQDSLISDALYCTSRAVTFQQPTLNLYIAPPVTKRTYLLKNPKVYKNIYKLVWGVLSFDSISLYWCSCCTLRGRQTRL